eukprot:gnl/TRDRNA2_/TRDRNA2_126572_c0_seq1.p1 gnl/TRDRNA2_/TRDRNA2_126572_c0~~gnl/TRDRNA2_/TRDRNA2_126572_c0_seq1.p1  ORF type:complete len:194 (-),score=32.69 gnl/TRDRNA2_/TRDRNA2_126572_c0_seq1:68-601(-)
MWEPNASDNDEAIALVLSPEARTLIEALIPGPYAFILPLRASSGMQHTCGLATFGTHEIQTLGIRLIPDPALLALVRQLDRPLLTTSLNITGEPVAGSLDEARKVCGRMGIPCVDPALGGFAGAESTLQRASAQGAEASPPQASTILRWDIVKKKFEVIRAGAGDLAPLKEKDLLCS